MMKTVLAFLRSRMFVLGLALTGAAAWVAPVVTTLIGMVVATSLLLQLDIHVSLMEAFEPRIKWRSTSSAAISRGLVGLSIDDVPLLNSPSHLEEILDVLEENNVHATLFVMSGFVESADEATRRKYESLLARAVANGHELGNHHMYDEPAFVLQPHELEKKFHHCTSLLKRLQQRAPRWHRPGSGIWTEHMLKLAEAAGYEATVLASCFPHDTISSVTALHRWFLSKRVRPGCIALVHDRHYTPDTLRAVLPRIRAKGLDCVTLSTLFDAAEDAGKSKANSARRVPVLM